MLSSCDAFQKKTVVDWIEINLMAKSVIRWDEVPRRNIDAVQEVNPFDPNFSITIIPTPTLNSTRAYIYVRGDGGVVGLVTWAVKRMLIETNLDIYYHFITRLHH